MSTPTCSIRTAMFLAILMAFFCVPPATVSASGGPIISLIQIGGDKASDEFVELFNPTDQPINLSGWSLRKKTKSDASVKGSSIKTLGAADGVPAHGHLVWANSTGVFKDFADVTTTGSLSADNSLGLFDQDGVLVDFATWGDGHVAPFGPKNFENLKEKERAARDHPTLSWSISKSPTPTNSLGEKYQEELPPPPPPSTSWTVRINEVFPNPKAKGDIGEFIEFYNFGENDIDLSGWTLRDASTTGKYVFPAGKTIMKAGYFVVTDQDFTLSLNNTKEGLSLFDSGGNLVHSVAYEKTKEGVTLNWVNGRLRGGRTPTPGAENTDNTDPVTRERVPKKGYAGVPVDFRARGSDSDGDALKFTWNFGDGHKSYKEKTSHTYEKTGRYAVTLSTDDGIDTAMESFEIEIKKYEYPKLRIVAFMPNPEGKDTEKEWVEIENLGKKEVNLKGFGIATGTKKLVNHPIRDDFIIEGKSIKRLTREDSLFNLPNQKGKIELRAPDGKVLQKLKYAFDESLDDDVVLRKEKGKRLTVDAAGNSSQEAREDAPLLGENDDQESATDREVLPADKIQATTTENRESGEKTLSPPANEPAVLGATTTVSAEQDSALTNTATSSVLRTTLWSLIERANALINGWFARE